MKKRILSIVLTICMVLMLLPTTVFAANADATDLQNLLNSGGTVTLSKDYTIDATLNVTNNVTLDLNGHVIKMIGSGSVINVGSGANLTMTDSNMTATHTDSTLPAGGVITGGNTTQDGGGVYVSSGCSMTMTGGTIYNCGTTDHGSGGGVYVNTSGSFTMKGGTIENCSAANGGGVYVAQSTFTMEGGTIYNCESRSSGGGIFVSSGTFTMEGGAIENCYSIFSGGGLCILASASGSLSTFTMTDGIIENCTSKNSPKSAAIYAKNLNIRANGGIVKGTVVFGSDSTINTTSTDSYTKFYDKVTNEGTISSGVYYGGIQDSSGTVSDTYHTVSFDSNGGSGSIPTQWYVNVSSATALQPADSTKDGYQAFDGWYNGDTKYDFTQPVTQSITLTAKFSNPKAYNISYDLDGGTATNPATYNVESDAITLNNPVKTGYAFTGWSGTGLTGENNMNVTIAKGSTGDRAYTAHYTEKNSFTVAFDTNGGSGISDKTGVKWTDTVLDGITAPTKDGWEFTGWKCGDETVNANTKYSDLAANDTAANVTLVAQWKDISAPTGEISIGTNKWNSFLDTITFGLFFKDIQTVTITATDNSGEDVTIEYLLSDKELTVDQLNSATFNAYNDTFSINPDNKYVIYAKLTDTSGNATYINSEGIVLDSIAPVISGIENGKTYCEAKTVTVTEEYIESVKVNGTAVTLDANNQFTLNPAEGTQTIVVTDNAGNKSTVTVTVNNGHTYGEWQSNGNDTHTRYCTVTGCDGYETKDCTGGEATCTSKAICEYCKTEYGEVDSSNHNLEKIPAKDATVAETGNKEYWHCKDCGKYFADEKGTNEIKLDDTVITVNAWDKTSLRLQATASRTSIKLKWNAVPEADGYVIYWNKCGIKNAFKQVKVIKSGKILTWTHTKLKKTSQNKYYVKAYKVINGKKSFIKTSNRIHLITKGGKYTNVKKLKSSVSSVTLKKGKTKTLKIIQTYAEKNKKPTFHMRPLTYITSDKKVAAVTSKGVIKAKGKGSCYIYITAYSGAYTRVKVKVK